MTNLKISFIVLALVLPLTGWGYSDPTAPPPGGNTKPPLNVGSERQTKEGNLGVKNLKARGGIELGGVFRDSWVGEGGRCSWEGTKCSCISDGASIGTVRVGIGATCTRGVMTDFRVFAFDISSRVKRCPANPLGGCTPELYTYQNKVPRESSNVVVRTAQGVVRVITNYAVRTFNAVRRFFRSLF